MPAKRGTDKPIDPRSLLHGNYATSYIGYIAQFPQPPTEPDPPPAAAPTSVPELAAYRTAGGGNFTQARGYRLHSFAAHLYFDGKGKVGGSGYVNIGGSTARELTFGDGNYTVDQILTPGGLIYKGTFETVDANNTTFTYHWMMSDHWRRLEFIVLKGNVRYSVVAGTLTRVGT